MKNMMKLIGTGGSTGVPVVGCRCDVCKSTDPGNKRLRSGAALYINDKVILIDAGPDIRQQCLMYGIDHIDGIFLTHYHEDHIGGLDDLRGFLFERKLSPIPVFLSENTYEMVALRFGYLLERFTFTKLNKHFGEFSFLGNKFSYHAYEQGSVPVLGFRCGKAAYLTDIKTYEDTIFDFLKGVETLVVSALNKEGSHMHFSLGEACEFGKRALVKSTHLVHMNHEVEYNAVSKVLTEGVTLATDGMEIDV